MNIKLHIVCLYSILLSSLFYGTAFSLTLDEALLLAKENLPAYKASLLKVKSSESLYNASLSPYFPIIDSSASIKEHYSSVEDYNSQTYDVTLNYTVFDGGKRRANRNIAKFNLIISTEEMNKNLLELRYSVKAAFYATVAQRDILEQRKIQLRDAQKDYDIASGKHKHGIVKLSDVLQASVRLEQAKYNVVQAEGDFKKAISELNSLIGSPLDMQHELAGSLDINFVLPERGRLAEIAQKRPDIIQSENEVKIAEMNETISRSLFFPVLSVNAAYTKTGGGGIRQYYPEEKTAGVAATWNIFELGKFYKLSAASIEKGVSKEKLNDLRRKILVEVYKTYEDYITACNKLKLAEQQLKESEHNYSQALGEYKAGKGDMLSLVHAESLLSNACEQLIATKHSIALAKSLLERVVGIEKIESVIKPDQQF